MTAGPVPLRSKAMVVPSADLTVPVAIFAMMPLVPLTGPDALGGRPRAAKDGWLGQAQRLPVMTVEIEEATLVPAARVPGRAGGDRAGGERFVRQRVDLGAVLDAEGQDHLRALAGVGELLAGEGVEGRLGQEHDLGVVVDDDRRHVLSHPVELEAEALEEGFRAFQVLDRQVHEHLHSHGSSLYWWLWWNADDHQAGAARPGESCRCTPAR